MHVSKFPSPSLIVSTADNSDALNVVLASIARQAIHPHEVFVADESTDHQSVNVVKNWANKLACPIVRFAPTRPGDSRAPLLNRVLRAATGDYLIFVDGDCLLHRQFIADHLRHADPGVFVQGRRAGIRARYIRRLSPNSFHPLLWFLRRRIHGVWRGLRRPWPVITINNARSVHGCNFAVWREDLLRVNGFNEAFDERGDEVVELAARLCNAGLTLQTITGQAIVYHLDHPHRARYRSLTSSRILEHTKGSGIARCEQGIVALPTSTGAETAAENMKQGTLPSDGETPLALESATATNRRISERSHFRDKIVPRSMLARIVQRCS
jgi:glycosyltransferase involved in cell wall biosynthesis